MEMQNNKLSVPIAIVVAGILIGGAIIYTNRPSDTSQNKVAAAPKTANIKAISAADHILGNPDAKVLMVEYSDTECPFCKLFDTTLHKVMDNYGKTGNVAWVYRPYPIAQLHSRAPKEAEAAECVNKFAGNDVYWKYLQKIYSVTPSNNQLDPAQLPAIATSLGVDNKLFEGCLSSGMFTQKIQDSITDAVTAGAQGTPFTVLVPKEKISKSKAQEISNLYATMATQYQVTPEKIGFVTEDGKIVVSGNLPYDFIKQIIDIIIS